MGLDGDEDRMGLNDWGVDPCTHDPVLGSSVPLVR